MIQNTIEVKIKRLYQGTIADVRDYICSEAWKRKIPIVIVLEDTGQKMTLNLEDMVNKRLYPKGHGKEIKSQFPDGKIKSYKLVSYKFIPDE